MKSHPGSLACWLLLAVGAPLAARADDPPPAAADESGASLPRESWDGPLSVDHHECLLLDAVGVQMLAPAAPDDSLPVRRVEDLPLVVTEPCFVTTGDAAIRMDREGCYRFLLHPDRTFQRILYLGDIPRFLGAIGNLQVHGWRDNGLTTEELIERAGRVCISITCGPIRDVALRLLDQQGIEARKVSTFTLDQWNSFDTGHALLEYRDPQTGDWILMDPDLGHLFRADGELLDADRLTRAVRNGRPWDTLAVNAGPRVDMTPACPGGNPAVALYGLRSALLTDPDQQRTWYRRVLQVTQLGDDYTVDTPAQRDRFEALCATANLDYTYLPPRAFREKYYPARTDAALAADPSRPVHSPQTGKPE
ncbi:MAG TPA: hypothetical protein PLS90_11300 [Candidatus Sumerlaeota bacterium]|nr:MAG: hypothetical protein BWZ08_00950 [candidate division BRC1 bacterium ADurb.BinA292]HOE96337.1 hypothetical protein [Candidatus Sumerlaeota bacterium]HOR29332.1 hypothetical protein [Candidatus Sumerlaeota bacterium]HPK03032.1 hypothetical protein [Candidatus Sumerlaeota bacterium]